MAKRLCPVCQHHPAEFNANWGYLPCLSCRQKQSNYQLPSETIEMTTAQIKEDRVRYGKEIRQPFRGDTFSREYFEEHGTQGVKVSQKELKNMRYVWGETEYYKR